MKGLNAVPDWTPASLQPCQWHGPGTCVDRACRQKASFQSPGRSCSQFCTQSIQVSPAHLHCNAPAIGTMSAQILAEQHAGVVGAQSVLFATSLSLVANQTLSGHSQMRFWFTYIIAAGMLALSVFWINQLTQVANSSCSTAVSKDHSINAKLWCRACCCSHLRSLCQCLKSFGYCSSCCQVRSKLCTELFCRPLTTVLAMQATSTLASWQHSPSCSLSCLVWVWPSSWRASTFSFHPAVIQASPRKCLQHCSKCCGNSSVTMQAQGHLYCWRT